MTKDTKQKVTIYSDGIFGMRKVEAKLVAHGTRKYAQYDNAPYVHFLPKRARKVRGIQGSYQPYILVLDGWGHPDLNNCKPAQQCGVSGLIAQAGKYSMCDPRWNTDADGKLDAYVAETNTAIVADYRHTKGFNPHRPAAAVEGQQ